MTHDELLATLNSKQFMESRTPETPYFSLRAVVELHYADFGTPGEVIVCDYCKVTYPCPTIQAIEKELGQ